MPVGDSFLYVQTIYVTAQGSGVTRLRPVTVFLNGRVGYGKNLDEALRRPARTSRYGGATSDRARSARPSDRHGQLAHAAARRARPSPAATRSPSGASTHVQ